MLLATTRHHARAAAVAGSLIALAAGLAQGADGPQYHIAQIGDFPERTQGLGINDHGEIILCTTPITPTLSTHAYRWRDGVLTPLPDLGGDSSYPAAINDAGQVAGSARTADGADHAVVWNGATLTELGRLSGRQSWATGITSAGLAVGTAEILVGTVTEWRAVIYDHGTVTELPTLVPDDAFYSSWAAAVADDGTVVGQADVQGLFTHPVVWKAGAITDLGVFAQGGVMPVGAATAIGPSGAIACAVSSQRSSSDPRWTESLFVWQDGAVTALPSLPAGFTGDYSNQNASAAYAMNSHGDLVGHHYSGGSWDTAALWRDGRVYALKDQVVAAEAAGWTELIAAHGITEHGEIVGTGWHDGRMCAFLLTPVDSDGTATGGSATTGGTVDEATGGGAATAGGVLAGATSGGSATGCGLSGGSAAVLLGLALVGRRARQRS